MAQELKLGRTEASEQCWRERIAAWRESGQTQQAFCQTHGLAISSFSRWKSRLARQVEDQPAVGRGPASAPERSPKSLRWTEVPWPEVGAEDAQAVPVGSGFEIVLPRGRSVRLGPRFETESLRRLLAVLEERSC